MMNDERSILIALLTCGLVISDMIHRLLPRKPYQDHLIKRRIANKYDLKDYRKIDEYIKVEKLYPLKPDEWGFVWLTKRQAKRIGVE